MTAIHSILAATDFSLDGNNAVRRAAQLAREHAASLHVLHVLKPSGSQALRDWFGPAVDVELEKAQARETLHRFALEIAANYDVTATVEWRVGDVVPTLLQAAERADLTVLGHRGHGRVGSLVMGSTAQRMLRMGRRPVLIVKQAAAAPYRRVLMPVDFTPSSDVAVRHAASLAGDAARLHVFHATDAHRESILRRSDVNESVIREIRLREQAGAGARMRRRMARLGLGAARMSFSVDRGPAVQATLRQAAAIGADLLVVGKQGGSTLADFLLGSVSGRLAADCSCDVMVVPRPREAPRPRAAAPHALRAPQAGSWVGRTA